MVAIKLLFLQVPVSQNPEIHLPTPKRTINLSSKRPFSLTPLLTLKQLVFSNLTEQKTQESIFIARVFTNSFKK